MKRKARWIATVSLPAAAALAIGLAGAGQPRSASVGSVPSNGAPASPVVLHKTVRVGGVDIFYREAGPKDAPTILLLHGFPTSSQMFRNLIPALADRYHIIAPDYPGYGHSSMPAHDEFEYTFDHLAEVMEEFIGTVGLGKFAIYVQDYGAPVGYRLAAAHPERITAIIVQNGNAYDEGIDNKFWSDIKAYWADPESVEKRNAIRGLLTYEATRWQYTDGVPNPELVSPDGPAHDQFLLDRPGNDEIQLDLFLSYGSNPPLYPQWQEYFRRHQPPMLIVWGKNDQIFPAAGAEPYKRDLRTLEFHLLDAGHFALESHGGEIAGLIRGFMGKHVPRR
jgi:pimeloyl-ACP methyl ester carboxylesterase